MASPLKTPALCGQAAELLSRLPESNLSPKQQRPEHLKQEKERLRRVLSGSSIKLKVWQLSTTAGSFLLSCKFLGCSLITGVSGG